MLICKRYEIASCDDVELGLKRETPLEIRVSYEDESEPKAVVLLISGLGRDSDDDYKQHLAQFVADKFRAIVVSVNYHCIGNRPQTGGVLFMDEFDAKVFQQRCLEVGIEFDGDLNSMSDHAQMMTTLSSLDEILQTQRLNLGLSENFTLNLSLSINPRKNEYQNFGIMQAQDVINALLFVKNCLDFTPPHFQKSKIQNLPVIAVGSSHGGYLSHLAAKIAPWCIDGIIDNSSYARYPWRFIGFGKELDYTKYCGCATKAKF